MDSTPDLTELLVRLRSGESGAADALYETVYGDLKRIAARLMVNERSGHTLQPTALVNELWLRFQDALGTYNDRRHFFRAAGLAMRHMLIDHARKRNSRIEGAPREGLDDLADQMSESYPDTLLLDEALAELERRHPSQYDAFLMVYFACRPESEVSQYLGVPPETVDRYVRFARAHLLKAAVPTKP